MAEKKVKTYIQHCISNHSSAAKIPGVMKCWLFSVDGVVWKWRTGHTLQEAYNAACLLFGRAPKHVKFDGYCFDQEFVSK